MCCLLTPKRPRTEGISIFWKYVRVQCPMKTGHKWYLLVPVSLALRFYIKKLCHWLDEELKIAMDYYQDC